MLVDRVCIITNYNLYESKRYFSQKFGEALKRKGIETFLIDAEERTLGADVIGAIQAFKPSLTCSFNSLLPISERRYLWDFLEIPHISFLVDPALYSVDLTRSPYSILTCVDRSDLEAIQSYQFENIFFWPHAIERDLLADFDNERTYEVVFFGSCYDYESLRVSWRQQNPELLNKVLDDAIDLVFSDPKMSLAQALVTAWNATGLNPEGIDFTTLFYYLDNYTRGRDRVELISSIHDAKVHVFGELSRDNAVGVLGWSQYLAKKNNVVLHPSVTYKEHLTILKQAKVTLNSMPFFKEGSHERVLNGLACGAVPVTTENQFFRETFIDGQDLFYYFMNRKDEVDAKVQLLLRDEPQRRQIARQGKEKVMKSFTWDHRVDELLKNVDPL
jgi:glycosyltransferase involved in cell wall biosynthesis